ncbi:MAG: cysteine desulfurase [Rhodocyclaceae bacterium]|jgi:cysteine desulfurase/selenocysteine lyase|uniref:Cysteine desulfurase n=1 Tax=Candidatus Desulfobacillus denitrificans TaxID=2608985 RepID=A0A809QXT2_9PROT|nr:cysteine desulfurase [Rhodocyclaceae bacterium]MCL4724290.1 cysteine desulfurase [Rhodocyclaceae bacterium]BBO20240.1 cysteine desulfurase [Candidatus Desulfobacillus denitrificans]GIK44688.1 MAG: cysteine desulfurase [Betaproteobacteria bacterium]GJQ54931.1 MAG: cysteine desulfurase [Rhodocyclaceae bacterium]
MMGADFQRLRNDFPLLARPVRGQRLAYLDSAATTQKPLEVIEALRRYYLEDNANTHRGVHFLSDRATELYEAARERVRRFVNAARADEIVFVRGTTEAINLVAATFGRAFLRAGDEILLSAMEHHSNIVPWQIACEQAGAQLRVVPIDDDGEFRFDEFERLIGPRTRLVAVTHVSNALGTVTPLRRIVERAHAAGVPVLADGAQAIAHAAVDVQALGCDFYAFSGHKLYAPMGIGVLYGKSEWLAKLPPYQGGGHMIRDVTFARTEYDLPPRKYEAGTPNVEGAVGLAAALDYLERIGLAAIGAHERALLDYATARVAEIGGLRVIGTAREKGAILSFVVDGFTAGEVGSALDRHGVAARSGHHCALPAMRRFGIEGTARASFALYNDREDVDQLVAALRTLRR